MKNPQLSNIGKFRYFKSVGIWITVYWLLQLIEGNFQRSYKMFLKKSWIEQVLECFIYNDLLKYTKVIGCQANQGFICAFSHDISVCKEYFWVYTMISECLY